MSIEWTTAGILNLLGGTVLALFGLLWRYLPSPLSRSDPDLLVTAGLVGALHAGSVIAVLWRTGAVPSKEEVRAERDRSNGRDQ